MEKNQKNYKTCNMCGDAEATSLCPSCFCYYCDDCHKTVHIRQKNKDHKKEPIDYNFITPVICGYIGMWIYVVM